jgi:hypothetical protein
MPINQNDDYNKLIKLLYPTIESSGNEYYGQTKKLILDNYLHVDDINFESFLDSTKVSDVFSPLGFKYCGYFNWRLGELHDSIRVITLADQQNTSTFPEADRIIKVDKDGSDRIETIIKDTSTGRNDSALLTRTAFARYTLSVNRIEDPVDIPAGAYYTYSNEISISGKDIIITEGLNPITLEPEDISDRNFFIDLDNNYLYIKICDGIIVNGSAGQSTEYSGSYLALKAVDGDILFKYTVHDPVLSTYSYSYPTYRYSEDGGSTWNNLIKDESIPIFNGNTILIELSGREYHYILPYLTEEMGGEDISYYVEYNGMYTSEDDSGWDASGSTFEDNILYTKFVIEKVDSGSNAKVEAYGSLDSVKAGGGSGDGSCAFLFKDCTLLTKAPKLHGESSIRESPGEYSFYRTFDGCTNLIEAPRIDYLSTNECCYKKMFYGCSKLSKIEARYISDISATNCTSEWLHGVSSSGINIFNSSYALKDAWETGSSGIPSGWVDEVNYPLMFVADGEVTISLNIGNGNSYSYCTDISHKYDVSEGWTVYSTDEQIELEDGDVILFKLNGSYNASNSSSYTKFIIEGTGNVRAYGNVCSLLADDQTHGDISSLSDFGSYVFHNLFADCDKLLRAPLLPASGLTSHCYNGTFSGCTSLEEGPELPAPVLANSCYKEMFANCDSLKKAPALPADELANQCYDSMFSSCTSLEEANLPAPILKPSCYYSMFDNCSQLKTLMCNCLDVDADDDVDLDLVFNMWLQNTSLLNTGILYSNRESNINLAEYIPSNWVLYTDGNQFNCKYAYAGTSTYKYNKLITSGTDSAYNGRGKLNEPDTLFNMSSTYSSNTIEGSYNNKDGLFTQDIWGYKSFNSPVLFRNGIYGECSSITTAKNINKNIKHVDDVGNAIIADSYGGSSFNCINEKCLDDGGNAEVSLNTIVKSAQSSDDIYSYNNINICSTLSDKFEDYYSTEKNVREAISNLTIDSSGFRTTDLPRNTAAIAVNTMRSLRNSYSDTDLHNSSELYLFARDNTSKASICLSTSDYRSTYFDPYDYGITGSYMSLEADNIRLNGIINGVIPFVHSSKSSKSDTLNALPKGEIIILQMYYTGGGTCNVHYGFIIDVNSSSWRYDGSAVQLYKYSIGATSGSLLAASPSSAVLVILSNATAVTSSPGTTATNLFFATRIK